MDLWDDAGLAPKGKSWYQEAGANMADTLVAADRQGGYTLTDMGTFLKYEPKLKLKVLFKGDPLLLNYYSVMAVCPDRFPPGQLPGGHGIYCLRYFLRRAEAHSRV